MANELFVFSEKNFFCVAQSGHARCSYTVSTQKQIQGKKCCGGGDVMGRPWVYSM
jgi:hypothetical protein